MSMISKEGLEQIQVIKNALDAMYDKLNSNYFVQIKKTKNVEPNFQSANVFEDVQTEFEAISGIVSLSETWKEIE